MKMIGKLAGKSAGWSYAIGMILLSAGLGQTALGQGQAERSLARAQQLIVVTTQDWNAVNGELQRYARPNPRQAWQPVGAKIPIVVGRNGMAWGRGLHGAPATLAQGNDPRKQEGDGKAPAGMFRLTAAFGYSPQAPRLKLPYVHASQTVQCVDDAKSALYNHVVDRAHVPRPDWQSHEEMRRSDEQYRWGVVVDHNAAAVGGGRSQATPRGGSCIFLHIWSGTGKGTAGCTAMAAGMMETVLYWLDAKKQPVLVQLPEREYARLKSAWRLP